ncbi:MAG: phage tail tube protein [Thalassobaculaceae bacterium]|nr:phage tail tube protein [Thalassobaculaceae bacterium]
MADTSRAQLYSLKESVWGTTPASAMTQLRYTSESLGYNINNVTSNEVRSDRQIIDLIQVGAEASGNIDFELSYGAHDAFLAGALFSDWGTPVAISVFEDIAASNAGSAFTSSATDFTASGIVVGQWVRLSGFAASSGANNGFYQVTSVTANSLGVSPPPASDEAVTGLTVAVSGAVLRNGVAESSFTLEKEFGDVGKFIAFTGMVANNLSLDIQTGQVLQGSATFMGKAAVIADATVGTGAPSVASGNDVMNAVNHIGEVREAGVVLAGTALNSLSVRVANGLRGIQAVGALGNVDIGTGRCTVTGSVSVYFSDGAWYQKYLAGTATSLSFRVQDGDGNAYVVTLPKVKLTSGRVQAGGNDRDVMADFDFQALRDTTTGCTIQIDRFAA